MKKGMAGILVVFLTLIITAGLIGGGGYYYFNKKATKEKNDLQAQIDDLNTKLIAAKKEAASTVTSTSGATATADETASWQTYSSIKWVYSIKFPKEYYYRGDEVQKDPAGGKGVQDLIISDVKDMNINGDNLAKEKIHVDVSTTESKGKTLANFVDTYKIGTTSGRKDIKLGSSDAIQLNSSLDGGGVRIYIFTRNNDFIYILRGESGNKTDTIESSNYVTMLKIMKTFSFSE